MTTPLVNSEFSVAAAVVKADKADRCQDGQRLIKAWVRDYNAVVKDRSDEWQDILMRGFSPYLKHLTTCVECQTYELSRRGRVLVMDGNP